jgi:hypothetical protein
MSAPGDTLNEQLDRLYGQPLDQFTRTRDELARELRKQGDRAAADRVKEQRKPSLIGWALNQVQRAHGDAIDELLAAGERLRATQQQLLEGGEQGSMRDAVAAERLAVERVVELAEAELSTAGHPANPTVQNKLRQTLHAAARDLQTRELLAAGRLLRETEAGDLGLGTGDFVLAPPSRPRSRPRAREPAPRRERAAEPERSPEPPPRVDAALQRKLRAARRRLEQSRERRREFEARAEEAERAAVEAERASARARSIAERARERADAEARRAEELRAALIELEPAEPRTT